MLRWPPPLAGGVNVDKIDEIVAERDASPSPATYDLSDRDYASGQFKARSDRAAKSKELRA